MLTSTRTSLRMTWLLRNYWNGSDGYAERWRSFCIYCDLTCLNTRTRGGSLRVKIEVLAAVYIALIFYLFIYFFTANVFLQNIVHFLSKFMYSYTYFSHFFFFFYIYNFQNMWTHLRIISLFTETKSLLISKKKRRF